MKKYPKFLAVIITLLFIGGMILTVFGIHQHYGDVDTTVFLSAKESNTGTGLSSEIMFTYNAPKGNEIDEDLGKEICSILKKRLQSLDINDAIVAYDELNSVFSVKLSYNARSSYDPNLVYGYLGEIGNIEVRAGNEKDENGLPSGETAKTVIADNDDLKKVTFSVEGSGSTTRLVCDLKYNGETRDTIKNYTQQVTDSEDKEDNIYSIWLDNEMVTSRMFSSVIKNGVIPAGTNVYTDDSQTSTYNALVMLASSEKLPFELTSDNIYNFSDPDNHTVFVNCLKVLVIAIAVLVLIFIFRYRLAGVANLIGWIGFFAISGIVVSGGFDSSLGIYVSKRVLACFLSVVTVFAVYSFVILERSRRLLRDSSSFKAVTSSYLKAEKDVGIVSGLLVVFAVIVYLLSRISAFFYEVKEVIVAFAVFTVIGYVALVLGGACVSKSLSSTQKLNNEKYYGG